MLLREGEAPKVWEGQHYSPCFPNLTGVLVFMVAEGTQLKGPIHDDEAALHQHLCHSKPPALPSGAFGSDWVTSVVMDESTDWFSLVLGVDGSITKDRKPTLVMADSNQQAFSRNGVKWEREDNSCCYFFLPSLPWTVSGTTQLWTEICKL